MIISYPIPDSNPNTVIPEAWAAADLRRPRSNLRISVKACRAKFDRSASNSMSSGPELSNLVLII